MASPQLPAYRVRARGAQIVRGLDESVTKFFQGRRTTALRICVAAVTRALEAMAL